MWCPKSQVLDLTRKYGSGPLFTTLLPVTQTLCLNVSVSRIDYHTSRVRSGAGPVLSHFL